MLSGGIDLEIHVFELGKLEIPAKQKPVMDYMSIAMLSHASDYAQTGNRMHGTLGTCCGFYSAHFAQAS